MPGIHKLNPYQHQAVNHTQLANGGRLFLAPALAVRGSAPHMEGDRAPAGRMVHEDSQRTFLVLEYVLAGGAATHHLPGPAVIRHGKIRVDQAVVTRLR